MNKIKVLLADDETDVADLMAKKVYEAGYETVTAYDGQEAWEKIAAELPDVVLLDINMPGLTGFEVLKKMRAAPPSNKWIPVIIVSARTELNDMQKGFELEADHYITKPCSMQDVIKAVRLMIQLIPHHKGKDEI